MKKWLSLLSIPFLSMYLKADVSQRLNIATQDGTVSTYPYKAKFSNGTVTDNGDGTVSITNTGGGGGGGTGGTINSANQFSLPYYSLAGSSNILSGFSGTTVSTNTGVSISSLAVTTLNYGVVQSSGNGQLINSQVSLSTSVTGSLATTSIAGGLLPTGVILADQVSLSTGVTGVLPATNLTQVSLSSSVIGVLPPTNLTQVSLSSSVIGVLPPTNLTQVSLSSSVVGTLPEANLTVNSTSYIQNTSSLQSGATAYPDFLYVNSSATIAKEVLPNVVSNTLQTNSSGLIFGGQVSLSSGVIGVLNSSNLTQISLSSGVTGVLPPTNLTQVSLSSSVIGVLNPSNLTQVSLSTGIMNTLPAANLSGSTTMFIQNTSSLQSGATAYPSFVYAGSSISAPTIVDSGLTSGNCVQAGTNGLLTTTGGACGSGGGGGGSGTINNATQFQLPYYSFMGSSNVLSGYAPVTISTNTGVTIATTTALGTELGSAGQVSISSNAILPGATFYQASLPYVSNIEFSSLGYGNVVSSGNGTLINSQLSLSSGVTGVLPPTNLTQVSLSSSVIGVLNPSNLTQVSLSSGVTGVLPPTNLTQVSLSSSVVGTLPIGNLTANASSYIQNTSSLQSGATAYPSFVYAGSSIAAPSAVFTQTVQVATVNVTGGIVVPTASQNFGKSNLNQWFTQMATAQDRNSVLTTANVVWLAIGDSHISQNEITRPFVDWLYSNFGNAGNYFPLSNFSESANSMRPNGCTYVTGANSTWTHLQDQASTIGMDNDQMHTTVVGSNIVGTCPGADQVTLRYVNQPNGGTISFSVDGGAVKTLSTNIGTTITPASYTITGLLYGIHAASVSYTTSGTAGVDVDDLIFYSSSTPGATVYRVGGFGIPLQSYLDIQTTTYEQVLSALPSTPTVVMLESGVNEARKGISPSTMINNAHSMMTRVRGVYPNINCVYMSPPDYAGSASNIPLIQAYEQAWSSAAITDGCGFIDFTALFSSETIFSSYYTDGTHLTGQGGFVAGQLLINEFGNSVSNVTGFTYNASSNVVSYGTDESTNIISNVTAFGHNVTISSSIVNSGIIGNNISVSSSNVFVIGGAVGSGVEQNVIMATVTANNLNANGLAITKVSALTFTGSSGMTNTYGITSGSATFQPGSSLAVSPSTFILNVSSGNGNALFGVQNSGHVVSSGTIPTVTHCATGPLINPKSTDTEGSVTWGGATASCNVIFASPWAAAPFCVVSSTGYPVGLFEPPTTSSMTILMQSAVTGSTVTWTCIGGQGS